MKKPSIAKEPAGQSQDVHDPDYDTTDAWSQSMHVVTEDLILIKEGDCDSRFANFEGVLYTFSHDSANFEKGGPPGSKALLSVTYDAGQTTPWLDGYIIHFDFRRWIDSSEWLEVKAKNDTISSSDNE